MLANKYVGFENVKEIVHTELSGAQAESLKLLRYGCCLGMNEGI
ncbi:hypothetical protein FH063_000502 [Azospirillum argentinense]|uniref:Uncharacterized protein n=1 Tax=Azospirillum argentinense TaxID=2970906 RepID=A0A5B0L0D1_9PROT|nr:hypothetical protein FH063_000502 [Azospirillum argentinense]